jgi:hypothetical protein
MWESETKESSMNKHTPTPMHILSSMTPDGKIGPRTIEAALKSNDEEVKDFIVCAVNAHEELLMVVKKYHEKMNDPSYHKTEPTPCPICEIIARAEGRCQSSH